MENWELALDRWLTTTPEDEAPNTKLICDRCGRRIFVGNDFYKLDGVTFCEDCAMEWLKEQSSIATEEDCHGMER